MCDFQWCDVGSSYYITATGNYTYANLLDFANIGILYPSYHGSCLTLTLTKTSRGTGGVLVFCPNLGAVEKITNNLKEPNPGGISFFYFQGVRTGIYILRCLFLRFQMDIKSYSRISPLKVGRLSVLHSSKLTWNPPKMVVVCRCVSFSKGGIFRFPPFILQGTRYLKVKIDGLPIPKGRSF